jgi:branched-chain amino acid transport system permease protein
VRRLDAAVQLLGPILLVVLTALIGAQLSLANRIYFSTALVDVAIVVALYVFVGNTGVLSFGHISFVAVGAFAAGVMSVPLDSKRSVLPGIYPLLRDNTIGYLPSLAVAAAVGGLLALVAGLALMRLSGLAAGIATFAVLEITHNILTYWTKIGPGSTTLSLVPETTDVRQAATAAVAVILVAFAYQRSRFGRMLRATREDVAAARAVGVNMYVQRLGAFTLSGALAGFAGGVLVHLLGSLTTTDVFLELTLITLAMLMIGGASSLLGAVVGALLVSGLDTFLSKGEQGMHLGVSISLPAGTRLVVLGALMALVLIVRPSGITGGRELSLPSGLRARLARGRR